MQPISGHQGPVLSVAFSRDGRFLATGSLDKTAKLWEVESGRAVRSFQAHTSLVFSVAFSPDGRLLATGAGDGAVRLWDAQTGQELVQLWHLREGGWFAITPKGYFAYDGQETTLSRISLDDARTGQPLSLEEVKTYHRPDLVRQAVTKGL